MSKIWMTADLHLFDDDIAKYRGFESSKDQDALIMANWNRLIEPDDLVYILGDISKADTTKATMFVLNHLKGHKILVPGNHDTYETIKLFGEAHNCQVLFDPPLEIANKWFICSHIPVHADEMYFFRANIHGHIHHPYPQINYHPAHWPNPVTHQYGERGYYNVNVEFHNYEPVPIEKIIEYFRDDI